MRKGIAILFLLVVLFNVAGYRLLISHLQTESNHFVEAQIDRDLYNDDELISIKTNLHLPYYTASPEFERVYGSININGTEYEYVKRRVHNDTLELLCIPNNGKTKLQQLKNELAGSATDGQASLPLKKASNLKLCTLDFVQNLTSFSCNPGTIAFSKFHAFPDGNMLPGFANAQLKPPRAFFS